MTGLHSRSLNTAIILMFTYHHSFKVPPTSHSCGMAYHSTAATEATKNQQQMKKKNDVGFIEKWRQPLLCFSLCFGFMPSVIKLNMRLKVTVHPSITQVLIHSWVNSGSRLKLIFASYSISSSTDTLYDQSDPPPSHNCNTTARSLEGFLQSTNDYTNIITHRAQIICHQSILNCHQ